MFRNSGSNSLGILGLTVENLFPLPDSQRKSLSNWLIIPRLDLPKCNAFQVLGLSFFLIGKCKTMYTKYFHRNLCPEELGFMLQMNLTTPLASVYSGILQGGLSPWETAHIRQLSLQIKAQQMPNPLLSPCHILASTLQGLSTPSRREARPFYFPFPFFKARLPYCF